MTEEELAAVSIALELLAPAIVDAQPTVSSSRWKLAARLPDLEMEELRALR